MTDTPCLPARGVTPPLGIIAHSTTSAPFGEGDEGFRDHVAAVLADVGALR